MLSYVKKLWETTSVLHGRYRGKSSSTYIEKPSFDDVASKSSKEKPEERIVFLSNKAEKSGNFDKTKRLSSDLSAKNIPKSTLERGCVKLESDKKWNKFFKQQNNLDTNITNKEPFSLKKGESHYHGKEIVGKIADQIKAEISEGMKNNTIGSIMIKEGKREENIVYPIVRVVLHAGKARVDIAKLLSGNICEKYDVRTITFCHPNQEKKRGACCYINDDRERVYEIISGLYEMTLKWYVDGKECKIKINIDGKNGVTLLEGNDVTAEQLRANKEVKVGKRREPKSLYEALVPQLQQKSSKSVKVLQQPSTSVTDMTTPPTSTSQRCSYPLFD